MNLNTFEEETPNLLLLPNLFVLCDKNNQTITYNGKVFYKYNKINQK